MPHPARSLRPVEINNVPGATAHVTKKAGMLKAAKAPGQNKLTSFSPRVNSETLESFCPLKPVLMNKYTDRHWLRWTEAL